ncbi:TRAF family member-associated NF-kappa-B activator isoform X2 [Synchiropus splendidus]|nr:TRAF family member-associated NF-kappa-B activator isoform X2 [Synchiropus splendidus]XP_053724748.1 TRAF family member-associated NF-kappa-B activator isoform X2 [Synchiropus splendidus]
MEEAYHDLFHQFMKLRSLCLRQAALLQQLTLSLQQKGEVPPAAATVLAQTGDEILKARAGVLQPPRNADCLVMPHLYMNVPQRCQETATPTPSEEANPGRARMPGTEGGNGSDLFLTSDLACQSHVCNFCQAVFPENSTTEGEFLRHLSSHLN